MRLLLTRSDALQEHFGAVLECLIEQPATATVQRIVAEAGQAQPGSGEASSAPAQAAQGSLWISPAPSLVKMRLFCLPYAGGVSENVFARQAFSQLLPASACAAQI